MTDVVAARRASPDVPSGVARCQQFRTEMRAQTVQRDGKDFHQLDGTASVVEHGYEMWDEYGPYSEVVDRSAFTRTLVQNPDVVFLVNHTGLPMARTTNGTLELGVDEDGSLTSRAFLNPQRQDVSDLVASINDGDTTEMSFAFTIDRGEWSPDATVYRILAVNLDRGDVSAVTYGANPATSISARARQMFEAIDRLDGPVLRAAQERLAAKLGDDAVVEAAGMSLSLARALLEREG